ncbi:MAG: formyltransferase family protein [Silicimonas sp.]|nr:formyltransferase family protein [Silicimonas sp.]
MPKKFIFVASTAGSVISQVLKTTTVRQSIHSVVADRPCGAVNIARSFGVESHVFTGLGNEAFCARLLKYVEEHEIDYILSFYTKFYSHEIRRALQDRIVNFHPSILPAFKGMDGFGDGLRYHVKLIGTTVELIKDVMDEGKIVMQTASPLRPSLSVPEMRHQIFVQQCKTLIQVVDWLNNNRISVEGDTVNVKDARYGTADFAPELENIEAISFKLDYAPGAANQIEFTEISPLRTGS